jgi:hypothetical protein
MFNKLKQVLLFSVCALVLSAWLVPQSNLLVDSAYARGEGGGRGGDGGGGRGGAGNGGGGKGGQGAGIGGRGGPGEGLGASRSGQASASVSDARAQGLAKRSDNPGAATSAAARSTETTGLAKAMSVVSTTAASVAAAFGLNNALQQQGKEPGDEGEGGEAIGGEDDSLTP